MSTHSQQINDLHQHELYLHFHQKAVASEKTNRECDYIIRQAGLQGQERILDLACGHGRHSLAFAKLQYPVCGIDMNAAFIQMAKEAARVQKLPVQFAEENILTANYKADFDLVLLLFNTLGFFDQDDVIGLFQKISQYLNPGGKAFIDCKNRDHLLRELKPYEVSEQGDDLMIDRLSFDPLTGTTTNRRVYIKDGIRYDTPFTMYSYHYQDLQRLIDPSGLQIQKVLGGWNGEPLDQTSRRIILVLEKPV